MTSQTLDNIKKDDKYIDKKFLTYDDICLINSGKSSNLIAIKTEGDLKIEQKYEEEPLKTFEQKKLEMKNGKMEKNQEEYLNMLTYSNRLYIESSKNKKPIDIYDIEEKPQSQWPSNNTSKNEDYVYIQSSELIEELIKVMDNEKNRKISRKESINSSFEIIENNTLY